AGMVNDGFEVLDAHESAKYLLPLLEISFLLDVLNGFKTVVKIVKLEKVGTELRIPVDDSRIDKGVTPEAQVGAATHGYPHRQRNHQTANEKYHKFFPKFHAGICSMRQNQGDKK